MNIQEPVVAELFASPLKIYSPVPRMTGEIIFSMENGSIYTFHPQEELPAKIVTHGGHASGIAMDARATTKLFLADMAHQAILSPEIRDPSSGEGTVTEELVQGFDGEPFLGPHSIVLSKNGEKLYFSDSGPWGETSIQNPKGSIYCIECDPKNIAPLAYNCLAYPSFIFYAELYYIPQVLRFQTMKNSCMCAKQVEIACCGSS